MGAFIRRKSVAARRLAPHEEVRRLVALAGADLSTSGLRADLAAELNEILRRRWASAALAATPQVFAARDAVEVEQQLRRLLSAIAAGEPLTHVATPPAYVAAVMSIGSLPGRKGRVYIRTPRGSATEMFNGEFLPVLAAHAERIARCRHAHCSRLIFARPNKHHCSPVCRVAAYAAQHPDKIRANQAASYQRRGFKVNADTATEVFTARRARSTGRDRRSRG